MATIMEGALWTLTDKAAERMVENGLVVRCDSKHCETARDVIEADLPIYHISKDAPAWFGFHSIADAIKSAEAHVEEVKNAEGSDLPAA